MTGSIHSPDLYYSEESYPISLSWKQIPFDLQTKGTPHRRKTVFFRALPKLPLPTRAGCRWRRQLDVQISLQHSTLSGGGQGSLSTSFTQPKLKNVIKPSEKHIKYEQIYSQSESEQQAVASLFLNILERRNLLLQEGLPGTETLDPPLYNYIVR